MLYIHRNTPRRNHKMYPSYLQFESPLPSRMPPSQSIYDYIPKPTIQVSDTELYFAYFSVYILFPLLYIIIATGNYKAVMMLWQFIKSGIFDTVSGVKEVLTNIVYSTLRLFGLYTFSTYTVVKNGREIYTASSMYFFYRTGMKSVYRIDRAKYNVCKWIDKQCALYKRQYGDEPELTETHNDIYDFILHKVDDEPYTRIHRGDFSARTHTLITDNYRKFAKSYQMADKAELTVCFSATDAADAAVKTPETFTINLKSPHHFFLEKNEILDKKFLQWKLYNEFGRKDVANYIGMPFSNYKLTMFYNECMKSYFPNVKDNSYPVYQLNDSHSILIGSRYVVKVDTVLRCPVLESGEQPVFDIDGILSSYYDCSDSAGESSDDGDYHGDGDGDGDSDSDSSGVSDIDPLDVDVDVSADTNAEQDPTTLDPEFELIEGETSIQ